MAIIQSIVFVIACGWTPPIQAQENASYVPTVIEARQAFVDAYGAIAGQNIHEIRIEGGVAEVELRARNPRSGAVVSQVIKLWGLSTRGVLGS